MSKSELSNDFFCLPLKPGTSSSLKIQLGKSNDGRCGRSVFVVPEQGDPVGLIELIDRKKLTKLFGGQEEEIDLVAPNDFGYRDWRLQVANVSCKGDFPPSIDIKKLYKFFDYNKIHNLIN